MPKGIIANVKAHFRCHQYSRAVRKYVSGLDDSANLSMTEVEALWFLAESWLNVKASTIKNCWDHTNIIQFKTRALSNDTGNDSDHLIPDLGLPIDDDLAHRLKGVVSELSVMLEGEGPASNDISEFNLEADESDLLVTQPYDTESITVGTPSSTDSGIGGEIEGAMEEDEEHQEAEESHEEFQYFKDLRSKMKFSYETLLRNFVPRDDTDDKLIKRLRANLDEIKADEISEKKQTDLRQFFSKK